MGNQFMTQLTDKIREAIIGNVGTVISGRIGIRIRAGTEYVVCPQ